jgi:hypothetical protein
MYPSNGGKFDPRKPCTNKRNSKIASGKLYHEINNLCLRASNKFYGKNTSIEEHGLSNGENIFQ